MQQQDLEQYLRDHRDDFDQDYPNLGLWAKIERELEQPAAEKVVPLRQRRPWYQIAAAAVLLLGLGAWAGAYLSGQTTPGNDVQAMIEAFEPEFQEMEQHYQQQIQKRYAQLTRINKDPQIDADLADLDKAMEELREELSLALPGQEEVIVQRLIETYRLKLQILEHVLNTIQDNSTTLENNNNNEEVSI